MSDSTVTEEETAKAAAAIAAIERGRLLFAQEGTMTERLADVSDLFNAIEPVMDIVDFIQKESTRPICQPKGDGAN